MSSEELTQAPEPMPSAESAPVESAKPDLAAEMEQTYNKVQARDARLPNESSYPKNPEATEAPETQPAQPDNGETVTPYDLVDPPQSWKADMHPVWQQLPTEAKNYIHVREQQMTQRLSEFGRMSNEASEAASRLGINEMADVLQRYAHTIPRLPDGQSLPPHAVLDRLLQANEMLLRDPETAIRWLAQDRGVDLARLAEAPVDPIQQVQQQARQEIERARQEERQSILAQLQQQEQQQRAAYEQQVASFVESFARDKPNWPQIEDEVRYHILALRGTNPDLPPHEILKTAYDRALASRPEADPRAKESAQKELAERKRKANEAKRLASLNVKSMIGAAPKSVGKDMYAEMADIYDRVVSR